MIQSLELENFKGIGACQRIEFAPLTLLFGANSAGKSLDKPSRARLWKQYAGNPPAFDEAGPAQRFTGRSGCR
jgi:hypothetical protein